VPRESPKDQQLPRKPQDQRESERPVVPRNPELKLKEEEELPQLQLLPLKLHQLKLPHKRLLPRDQPRKLLPEDQPRRLLPEELDVARPE
jgi:hypothetical protein